MELTNGCIVGAACQLTYPEIVPENTVIFGSKCSRRQQADRPPVSYIGSQQYQCHTASFYCVDCVK